MKTLKGSVTEEWQLEWKSIDDAMLWRGFFVKAGAVDIDERKSVAEPVINSATMVEKDSSVSIDLESAHLQVDESIPEPVVTEVVDSVETKSMVLVEPVEVLHSTQPLPVDVVVVVDQTPPVLSAQVNANTEGPGVNVLPASSSVIASATKTNPLASKPAAAAVPAASTSNVANKPRPVSLGRRSSNASDNSRDGYLTASNDSGKTKSPRYASINFISGSLQLSAEKAG